MNSSQPSSVPCVIHGMHLTTNIYVPGHLLDRQHMEARHFPCILGAVTQKMAGNLALKHKEGIVTSGKEGGEAVWVQGQHVQKQEFRDRSCIVRTLGRQSFWTTGLRQRKTCGISGSILSAYWEKWTFIFSLILNFNPNQSCTYFIILISPWHLRGEMSFLLHQQTFSVVN